MAEHAPLRLLVLCTGNSARSQIAEALFNTLGRGRIIAESAGSQPAPRVNPLAIETLQHFGVAWSGRGPRGLDALPGQSWDIVLTVCDRAREACPVFPGHPVTAHWGIPDPAAVEGPEDVRRAAFRDAFTLLKRRIDLMLALPVEKLERLALETRLRAIGQIPETPS